MHAVPLHQLDCSTSISRKVNGVDLLHPHSHSRSTSTGVAFIPLASTNLVPPTGIEPVSTAFQTIAFTMISLRGKYGEADGTRTHVDFLDREVH